MIVHVINTRELSSFIFYLFDLYLREQLKDSLKKEDLDAFTQVRPDLHRLSACMI